MRRLGIIVSTLLLALGVLAPAASAADQTVTVHLQLPPGTFAVFGINGAVSVHATAQFDDGSVMGIGTDSPSFCRWPLDDGSIDGNTITLHGVVTHTIAADVFVGVHVTMTGTDIGEGANDPITWTFDAHNKVIAPLVLVGTGVVKFSR